MRVKLIGFTKEGYHRELACLSEQQVHMTTGSISGEIDLSCITKGFRSGIEIYPKEFPEVVRFNIIVED